ncbi:hypothetical protein ABZP36_029100 [Zizania latifolia]
MFSSSANKRVFREYLGAQWSGVRFTDVPVNPHVDEFHYILAFTIDYTAGAADVPPVPTNGNFRVFWDTRYFTPDAVAEAKRKNSNVRVMLSVGGATVKDVDVVFTPATEDTWVRNAVNTLGAIIDEYHLDGVDIDYEQFHPSVEPDLFTRCIGRLLTELKAGKPAGSFITSIAPYPNKNAQRLYRALWNSEYQMAIDYVNFQFYAYGHNIDVPQYIDRYNEQANAPNFPGGRVLAAINTNNPAVVNIVNPDIALEACNQLNQQLGGKLPGIFIWSADGSLNQNQGFFYETQAQLILTGGN